LEKNGPKKGYMEISFTPYPQDSKVNLTEVIPLKLPQICLKRE